jgi:murein DD-endopeptidase MepM/ murein hydrolase activator NlpD
MQLGYWCDVEVEKNADKLTARSVIRWMELVEAEVGRCGIYVGFYGWHDIMGAEAHRYADRKLWLAAYVKDPMDYIPGDWLNYDLWQYTSTGKLDGYVAWDKELQKYVLGNLDMSKRGQMYPNKLVYPIDPATRISQKFGANPGWYPTSKGHNGIDWAAAVGTPVYAMQDGVVIIAEERQEKSGYGRQVRIQHNEGMSIYGHLSKLMVSKNDTVKAGQQIGLSGGNTDDPCSGFSTGPHLHAEYRLTSGAPQVPGGFAYGAIDMLPLLTGTFTPPEPEQVLYRVRVTIPDLLIRSGAGRNYPVVYRYASGEYDIFEEKNGYGRIGAGRWIALEYTQKLGTLTLEERVTALEKAVFGD